MVCSDRELGNSNQPTRPISEQPVCPPDVDSLGEVAVEGVLRGRAPSLKVTRPEWVLDRATTADTVQQQTVYHLDMSQEFTKRGKTVFASEGDRVA
jgi:hypothetical protein